MKRFTQRSKDMDPKLEAFAYPTLDLKIARFIELHVNSKTNTITFTPERFKELTEYVGRKTLIRYYYLKPLQDADVIKFVWTNNGGRRVYMMNPAWSSQFNDADQEKYTDLYNRFVDGDGIGNIKIKYGIIDTKDELEDTEENEGEDGSNKSNNEQEEPKGDSKEIVCHPEAETVIETENFSKAEQTVIPSEDKTDDGVGKLIDYLADIVIRNAPKGIDKNRLGTWLVKGNLQHWFQKKSEKHASNDFGKILEVYSQPDQFSELYTIFKSGGKI